MKNINKVRAALVNLKESITNLTFSNDDSIKAIEAYRDQVLACLAYFEENKTMWEDKVKQISFFDQWAVFSSEPNKDGYYFDEGKKRLLGIIDGLLFEIDNLN